MTCCKLSCWSWAALSFAFLGWVIYIAGVGSLHYACHHELDYTEREALMQASGIVPHKSCAYTFGWYWFLTFFQLCAVLYAMVAAAGAAAGAMKPGALVLVAIITTLLLDSTKVFLQLHYNLPRGYLFDADATTPITAVLYARAAKCALAGGILCCVFNALSALALGWRRDCACPTSERSEVQTPAGACAHVTIAAAKAEKASTATQV